MTGTGLEKIVIFFKSKKSDFFYLNRIFFYLNQIFEIALKFLLAVIHS